MVFNFIDRDVVVYFIKEHKKKVICDSEILNDVYALAHDQIVKIINSIPVLNLDIDVDKLLSEEDENE